MEVGSYGRSACKDFHIDVRATAKLRVVDHIVDCPFDFYEKVWPSVGSDGRRFQRPADMCSVTK